MRNASRDMDTITLLNKIRRLERERDELRDTLWQAVEAEARVRTLLADVMRAVCDSSANSLLKLQTG